MIRVATIVATTLLAGCAALPVDPDGRMDAPTATPAYVLPATGVVVDGYILDHQGVVIDGYFLRAGER